MIEWLCRVKYTVPSEGALGMVHSRQLRFARVPVKDDWIEFEHDGRTLTAQANSVKLFPLQAGIAVVAEIELCRCTFD